MGGKGAFQNWEAECTKRQWPDPVPKERWLTTCGVTVSPRRSRLEQQPTASLIFASTSNLVPTGEGPIWTPNWSQRMPRFSRIPTPTASPQGTPEAFPIAHSKDIHSSARVWVSAKRKGWGWFPYGGKFRKNSLCLVPFGPSVFISTESMTFHSSSFQGSVHLLSKHVSSG